VKERPLDRAIAMILLGLIQAGMCLSCSCWSGKFQPENTTPHPWVLEKEAPGRVAVLPFVNDTPVTDIGVVTRESFYRHFSTLNYYDIELARVDQALSTAQRLSGKDWSDLTPRQLGDILHVDLIIFGRVKDYEKYFLAVYAQIALEVEVRVVRCTSGRVVWKHSLLKRSHEGGMPLGPFGIAPAAIRSGLHLREEETVVLVDRLNRDMVAQMPNPALPSAPPTVIEIQVASFKIEERAEHTLRDLQGAGLQSWIRPVKLASGLWYRVFLGPYYGFAEAEAVCERIRRNTAFRPILIRLD
jgi:hypothetical protein